MALNVTVNQGLSPHPSRAANSVPNAAAIAGPNWSHIDGFSPNASRGQNRAFNRAVSRSLSGAFNGKLIAPASRAFNLAANAELRAASNRALPVRVL